MAFDADGQPNWGVLLFLVAIPVVLAGRVFARHFLRGLLASGWYVSQGRVELGNVEEHHIGRYMNYYVARIDYSYSVNNEYYSGYFERTFLRESSADRFVGNMKAQPVYIRSSPNRPQRSALLRQDQPGGWPA